MSVAEFQDLMNRTYFDKDSKRGPHGTYEWLREEVIELGDAMQGKDRQALEDEFADVFAWLTSLANILGVDLERAALKKYADGCPKCHLSPCRCVYRETS
ncbi:MAG: nucleotide pyrophosphohydrolase [Candidatus Bathyarchaeota archaeon]|nr:MAG: nucleotide pyrophosphohydrolase [Candidatus Bathyarchaeota archaeon]